jgi:hypothetical protein
MKAPLSSPVIGNEITENAATTGAVYTNVWLTLVKKVSDVGNTTPEPVSEMTTVKLPVGGTQFGNTVQVEFWLKRMDEPFTGSQLTVTVQFVTCSVIGGGGRN